MIDDAEIVDLDAPDAEPKVTLLTTRAGRVFGIEYKGKVLH